MVDYAVLVSPLIEATKEQSRKIASLDKRNEDLELLSNRVKLENAQIKSENIQIKSELKELRDLIHAIEKKIE